MLQVKVIHQGAMRFKAESDEGLAFLMDSPAEGETAAGMSPMEALLGAAGACSGMDVITILINRHQEITGYEIRISGERAEEHPRVYTSIDLLHILRGKNLNETAVRQAVESSTVKYCSVLNMLKETAVLNITYRIENE